MRKKGEKARCARFVGTEESTRKNQNIREDNKCLVMIASYLSLKPPKIKTDLTAHTQQSGSGLVWFLLWRWGLGIGRSIDLIDWLI